MLKRFKPEELVAPSARLAAAAGVAQEDAEVFAQAVVDADVHSITTHGLSRLNIYLQRLQKGLIAPRADLVVDRDGGSILALDAGNGLGQVQAVKSLRLLKPLAERNGVAAATIRNSLHFGALSYFCNLAADDGMILLATTNGEPAMSPAGGHQPFFGTNPIAASFPTGKGFHVKIDMATSIVARGNIIAAARKGESIPEGWALDPQGNATTDAQQALLGTVLTMAGHKGYALALMIEVFSSVLSGASIGSDIGSMYKNMDRRQDAGHFFCLLKIDAFMDLNEFKQRMDQTIDRLKSGQRRLDVDEILVPGEQSARKAAVSSKVGISLADETLKDLKQWCDRFGLPFTPAEIQG